MLSWKMLLSLTIQSLLVNTSVVSFIITSKYKSTSNQINSCTLHTNRNRNRNRKRSLVQNYKANDNTQEDQEDSIPPNGLFSIFLKNLFPNKNSNTTVTAPQSLLDEVSLLNVESLLSFMEDGNSSLVSESNSIENNTAITSALEDDIIFNDWMQFEDLLRDTVARVEGLVFPSDAPTLKSTTAADEIVKIISDTDITTVEKDKTKSSSSSSSLEYTTRQVLSFVNTVLSYGYISDEESSSSAALFSEYSSITNTSQEIIETSSRYAALAANVYDPGLWKNEILNSNYSIVGNGTISDVNYLVTDSIENGELIRTITVKGFDATDGSVDRERLLRDVITAYSESISVNNMNFEVHQGLLSIARAMYSHIMEKYVDTLGSSHKLMLCGHSIGGSISILIMMLMVQDRGAEFVKDKIGKVFSFGAPPVIQMPKETVAASEDICPILASLDLPNDIVLSFIQPWDPIPRLFTTYDPLYPLVDDLGDDGVTPYINGPPRALRPVVKALVEIWSSWPSFREPLKEHLYQDYIPIGSFYLLLPETTRYLTDRLISIDISVPPLDTVLTIPMSGTRFLFFLNQFFPLTVLRVSTVPVALRSFIHHFYPAYNNTLNDFVDASKKKTVKKPVKDEPFSFPIVENDDVQSNLNYLIATISSFSKSIPNNLDLTRMLRMGLQQNTTDNTSTADKSEYTFTGTSDTENEVVEYSLGKGVPQLIGNIVAIFVASFVQHVIVPFQESSPFS